MNIIFFRHRFQTFAKKASFNWLKFSAINQSHSVSLPLFTHKHVCKMSALFNFQSLLTVVLLLVCTCTYLRAIVPSLIDKNKQGLLGTFWKCARVGERKSPYVAVCCVAMALSILFWS